MDKPSTAMELAERISRESFDAPYDMNSLEVLDAAALIEAHDAAIRAESAQEIAALKDMLETMTDEAEDYAKEYAEKWGSYRIEEQGHKIEMIKCARALLAEREEPK
jgi:ribosomal protein L7/L12